MPEQHQDFLYALDILKPRYALALEEALVAAHEADERDSDWHQQNIADILSFMREDLREAGLDQGLAYQVFYEITRPISQALGTYEAQVANMRALDDAVQDLLQERHARRDAFLRKGYEDRLDHVQSMISEPVGRMVALKQAMVKIAAFKASPALAAACGVHEDDVRWQDEDIDYRLAEAYREACEAVMPQGLYLEEIQQYVNVIVDIEFLADERKASQLRAKLLENMERSNDLYAVEDDSVLINLDLRDAQIDADMQLLQSIWGMQEHRKDGIQPIDVDLTHLTVDESEDRRILMDIAYEIGSHEVRLIEGNYSEYQLIRSRRGGGISDIPYTNMMEERDILVKRLEAVGVSRGDAFDVAQHIVFTVSNGQFGADIDNRPPPREPMPEEYRAFQQGVSAAQNVQNAVLSARDGFGVGHRGGLEGAMLMRVALLKDIAADTYEGPPELPKLFAQIFGLQHVFDVRPEVAEEARTIFDGYVADGDYAENVVAYEEICAQHRDNGRSNKLHASRKLDAYMQRNGIDVSAFLLGFCELTNSNPFEPSVVERIKDMDVGDLKHLGNVEVHYIPKPISITNRDLRRYFEDGLRVLKLFAETYPELAEAAEFQKMKSRWPRNAEELLIGGSISDEYIALAVSLVPELEIYLDAQEFLANDPEARRAVETDPEQWMRLLSEEVTVRHDDGPQKGAQVSVR
jgi:hypothetical protein